MASWQPFFAFYISGIHWRHLANTTEPFMCGGDAALCQITLTACYGWNQLKVIPLDSRLCTWWAPTSKEKHSSTASTPY